MIRRKSDGNQEFHIDFVIVDGTDNNGWSVIRKNNKKETPQHNEFTWNQMPNLHEAYKIFKNLHWTERQQLIEKEILPAKYIEKQKDDSDDTKIASSELFIRKVMEYDYKKKNH